MDSVLTTCTSFKHMGTRALTSRLLYLFFFHAFTISQVLSAPSTPPLNYLEPRDRYILRNNTLLDELQAFNPITRQIIPQGLATDGGGRGLDVSSAIWITLSLLTGLSLSFAGFRLWRGTTGIGFGLAAAVCAWAAFVNTMSAKGIDDIILTIIVLAFFLLGFIAGIFEIGRVAGMVLLGVTSGLSFGIRLMLLRSGLLFSPGDDGDDAGFALAWILIALLGFIGGGFVVWPRFQRYGMLFACTANGTFLAALGLDLILNKQGGMGQGLIFLFDRNSSHIVDVITKGYKPPITTQIIIGASLALIPILSLIQNRVFKDPFNRRNLDLNSDDTNTNTNEQRQPTTRNKLTSTHQIFSGLWDGALFRGKEKGPN